MKLTLADTARLLGKSPRQIRYMLKEGEIEATKVEGRWVFDDDKLPKSPGRAAAKHAKAEELKVALDEALRPHLRPTGHKGYSVTDLIAFRTGVQHARSAAARLGHDHAAAVALRASVVAIAKACHSFHQREKSAAFLLSREHAAEAVAHLHLEGSDGAGTLGAAIEQDYLSAIVGLLRRQERKERR